VERRRRPREGAALAKKRRWLHPVVKRYLPYALGFLVILAPMLYNPPRPNTLPPYLVGVWESSSPGYKDRYMRLLNRHVIFGTGGYDGEAYVIAEVRTESVEPEGWIKKEKASKTELVRIRYMKKDQVEYELSFFYDPEPVGTITFKNQDIKWRKKG